MKTLLVPLGINGYIPSFGRHTTSFLLVRGRDALLLDAGTGVARLLEPHIAELLRPCERVHIALSHYHLDHIVGLSYLIAACPGKAVRVYAPAHPFVQANPAEVFDLLFRPPLFPYPLRDFPMPVELIEISRPQIQAGPFSLRFHALKHPGGSMGIRVEDLLAFITDTVADEAMADFARGVEILLHEVWLTDEEAVHEPNEAVKHAAAGAVARVARASGAGRLLTIHHRPTRSMEDIQIMSQAMAKSAGIPVDAPEEGRPLSFQSGS